MKTLGQLLIQRREERDLTLEQAATDTKIRKQYLNQIENGDYQNFPIPLQLKGFITIYARYLDIEPEEALAFYRREFPEKEQPQTIRFKLPQLKRTTFHITSQLIIITCLVAIIGGAMGYIIWQYLRFAGAPKLEIFSPRDGLVSTTETIRIEGTISPDARLTLNNTSIRITEEGYFTQDISLSEDINVLTFVAVNSSGKSTTVKRIVRYDSQ